jgi:predicted nuclease with TOPRIM domain
MKKLEEIFNLPTTEDDMESSSDTFPETENLSNEEKREIIHRVDDLTDKIDAALPAIRGLEMEDAKLDEYADKLVTAFDDLMTLGYNVDSRFSSEIFNAAGSMMGHALTAKQAKINKKMKTIDLQMKKLKLDSDLKKAAQAGKISEDDDIPTAEGHILSRNELLELMLGKRDNSDNKSDDDGNDQ